MTTSTFNDYIIGEQIKDTVEKLEFSKNAANPYFLASGGWDNILQVWRINIDRNNLNIRSIYINNVLIII